MATTDARPGFRLPWTSDQRPPDEDGQPVADGAMAAERGDAPLASDDEAPEAVPAVTPASNPAPVEPARPAARKPTKFLADLTKAMQAAAESAREETLSRFQAEAKSFIEQIHSRSAEEATELRRRADDDVIAIRDWSKAEIARIREETESRITDRKARLEREVEDHAALVEGDIERVHGHVAAFESQMAAFFERLLAEDDPSRFASMAENLPEPPSFDSVVPAVSTIVIADTPAAAPADATAEPAEPAAEPDPWADAAWSTETAAASDGAGGEASEARLDTADAADGTGEADETAVASGDDSQASAAEPNTYGAHEDEPVAPAPAAGDPDPRLSALGLSADFAAAEAAAFAEVDAGVGEDFPELSEDAIAARLAGLVDDAAASTDEPATEQSTRVVVVGLVSVASIASFKRHLGRLPGVASVGVSSGPDGEFVFAVSHAPEMSLSDVIPTLPGFQARVTGTGDGQIDVTAHDPESGA